MKEVIRDLGVSEQTYYRWRREYGGMKTSQAKRLKELEKENQRLKRAVADLTVDNMILKEASKGKLLSPERRRRCVVRVQQRLGVELWGYRAHNSNPCKNTRRYRTKPIERFLRRTRLPGSTPFSPAMNSGAAMSSPSSGSRC